MSDTDLEEIVALRAELDIARRDLQAAEAERDAALADVETKHAKLVEVADKLQGARAQRDAALRFEISERQRERAANAALVAHNADKRPGYHWDDVVDAVLAALREGKAGGA